MQSLLSVPREVLLIQEQVPVFFDFNQGLTITTVQILRQLLFHTLFYFSKSRKYFSNIFRSSYYHKFANYSNGEKIPVTLKI